MTEEYESTESKNQTRRLQRCVFGNRNFAWLTDVHLGVGSYGLVRKVVKGSSIFVAKIRHLSLVHPLRSEDSVSNVSNFLIGFRALSYKVGQPTDTQPLPGSFTPLRTGKVSMKITTTTSSSLGSKPPQSDDSCCADRMHPDPGTGHGIRRCFMAACRCASMSSQIESPFYFVRI